MSGLGKLVRGLIGVVVIVVLLGTINVYVGQYRRAQRNATAKKTSTKSTPSVDATAVVAVQGQSVVILADGVNMRSKPETSSKSVRAVKKGETLVLVGVTGTNWMQLRDPKGAMGFVVNNPSTLRVQK